MSDQFTPPDDSRARSCARVLEMLQAGPVTTNEFRAAGIASPAPRIFELRRLGHNISTSRAGAFARYTLHRAGAGLEAVGCFAVALFIASPAVLALLDIGGALV
jgi:hypothetical protein